MRLPRLWNNCVPPIPAHAILIGELHRTKPKVLLLRKARRKRCNRLHKCQRLGMTPHKRLYLRWIALGHAPQKLQKLLPRSRRKSINRMRNNVRVHMLCKVEPDRHADGCRGAAKFLSHRKTSPSLESKPAQRVAPGSATLPH